MQKRYSGNYDMQYMYANIAKGTTDPGVDCFNQIGYFAYSAYFACFAYFVYFVYFAYFAY